MVKKRAIFEEVSDRADQSIATKPKGGMIDAHPKGARGAVRRWLMVLFAFVVIMIAVGGLTRLTDSGLSITEWRPVTGAIPPLNAADWALEFEKYRTIPEYALQNQGMSLAEFKVIYWWEWGHRQLGRVIGLIWAVGFLFFLLTKQIPVGWTARLLLLGVLGGLQGAIGWWMVQSGLTGTMLDVASYRLAVHLGLAFIILGFISWFVLLIGRQTADLRVAARSRENALAMAMNAIIIVGFVQILLGALVAGIDAGRSYTDWPLMSGQFLPPELWSLQPWWRNFFEEAGLVQFMHRMWGYILFLAVLGVWYRSRRSPHRHTRFAFSLMMAVILLQIIIGVVTVRYVAPWHLAIIHQFFAVVVWVLILRARFFASYPVTLSLREGG